MDRTFHIVFTMKTAKGTETFARFFLGNDAKTALDIFRKLRGTEEVNDRTVLTMEYVERRGGLPVNLKVQCCTLEELADNCKVITKELFKIYSC